MAPAPRKPPKAGAGGKRAASNAGMDAQRRKQQGLLKLGGILAAIAAVLAFFFQAGFGLTGGVVEVKLNETEALKQIFFGGEPWLVQCVGPGKKLDSNFVAAAPYLAANKEPYSVVKTAAIQCGDKLPSGKTVYQRFNLNPSTHPLVTLFANGEKPLVVSAEALELTATLVKRVSEASKLRISEVSTPSSFGRACLSKPNKLCLIILPYTALTAEHNATLRTVAGANRGLQFALINTASVQVSVEKSLPKLAEGDEQVRVVASKVYPDNTASALAYRGAFEPVALGAWLDELVSGETDLNMLSKKPNAARRRIPINEDEASKAERKRTRKAERKAAEEMLKADADEALKTLSPKEREAREAEMRQRQAEWEKRRREQMEAEAGSIFEDDDDNDEEEEEEVEAIEEGGMEAEEEGEEEAAEEAD
mmetsp:Transcript_36963/g.85611  ORF Transcript_36963/g.85611 Transcript_36963/m.85611 type:complete len:423 (+) Transcript_36963:99-1367(+)